MSSTVDNLLSVMMSNASGFQFFSCIAPSMRNEKHVGRYKENFSQNSADIEFYLLKLLLITIICSLLKNIRNLFNLCVH